MTNPIANQQCNCIFVGFNISDPTTNQDYQNLCNQSVFGSNWNCFQVFLDIMKCENSNSRNCAQQFENKSNAACTDASFITNLGECEGNFDPNDPVFPPDLCNGIATVCDPNDTDGCECAAAVQKYNACVANKTDPASCESTYTPGETCCGSGISWEYCSIVYNDQCS